jgi:hypothetical protein
MTMLLAEIMDAPEFGEVMFLVAFILFVIEFVLVVTKPAGWTYNWLLMVAGLACVALGWLALPTDPTP